ncbi:MAG: hypothetical protein EON60_05500 [Alphaproteobacteria bacterium]|nr:MAG: hypothetical protein EON60_05500 [Alphaproteobacteria bacterium]
MPNATASATSPRVLDITLHTPTTRHVKLLLPVLKDYLRAYYIRYGNKRLTYWEKQSLYRTPRNFLRKGLVGLQLDLKKHPEKTLHMHLTVYLTNLARHRKHRALQQDRLALLKHTTEETLLELATLAADSADTVQTPAKSRPR